MSKQPYYHRCDGALLFTTTVPVTEEEAVVEIERAFKKFGVLKGSVEFESLNGEDGKLYSGWNEPLPGDPSDLPDTF